MYNRLARGFRGIEGKRPLNEGVIIDWYGELGWEEIREIAGRFGWDGDGRKILPVNWGP